MRTGYLEREYLQKNLLSNPDFHIPVQNALIDDYTFNKLKFRNLPK